MVDIDDLIINYGFVSSLGAIKEWGLKINKNAIIVNSKQETNISGIYAAGDICTYDGKVKLIASGFGEGPTAVNNAKAYIDPLAKFSRCIVLHYLDDLFLTTRFFLRKRI